MMHKKLIFLLTPVTKEFFESKLIWAEDEAAARASIGSFAKIKLPGASTEYQSEQDFPYEDRQKVQCQKLNQDQYVIECEDEIQIDIRYQSVRYALKRNYPKNIQKIISRKPE